MTHPRALWAYRITRLTLQARLISRRDKESSAALGWWTRQQEVDRVVMPGSDLSYFELVRRHAADGLTPYAVLPLFGYALLLRPRRILELGCSYSYYPKTYPHGDPWVVADTVSEGLVSTRLLLTACRLLEGEGIQATLTSVDMRSADHPFFARGQSLLGDLGLAEWWRPVMGVDSVSWLLQEATHLSEGSIDPIDLAFVDSNHTYAHVRAELEALLPIMAPHGVVLVDNCYALLYDSGLDWMPGDGAEGVGHGGEYGAILDCVAAHPEWSIQWDGRDLAVLRRSKVAARLEWPMDTTNEGTPGPDIASRLEVLSPGTNTGNTPGPEAHHGGPDVPD